MKKKAEITLENTLTVLIAVLCLILVGIAVYKLYSIIVNQEQENAKNFLNIVEAKINNLKDGETGKFSIRGVDSKDGQWFLTGWSKDDPARPDKKIECFLDSCICICKGNGGRASYDCNGKDGFCRKVEKEEIKVNSVLYEKKFISDPLAGKFASSKEKTFTKSIDYIPLPKNLIELKITKEKDSLIISIEENIKNNLK